jgi:hypothetical protein
MGKRNIFTNVVYSFGMKEYELEKMYKREDLK